MKRFVAIDLVNERATAIDEKFIRVYIDETNYIEISTDENGLYVRGSRSIVVEPIVSNHIFVRLGKS